MSDYVKPIHNFSNNFQQHAYSSLISSTKCCSFVNKTKILLFQIAPEHCEKWDCTQFDDIDKASQFIFK